MKRLPDTPTLDDDTPRTAERQRWCYHEPLRDRMNQHERPGDDWPQEDDDGTR